MWVDSAAASSSQAMRRDNLSSNFRLSIEAHVRLIAALDKSIPYWLETNQKPRRTHDSLGQFDLALARVVGGAGGQITIAEAYRALSHPAKPDCPQLTIENFLRMLRKVEYTVIEFKDPQSPMIRLHRSNDGDVFFVDDSFPEVISEV
jgi:hypothetical protein